MIEGALAFPFRLHVLTLKLPGTDGGERVKIVIVLFFALITLLASPAKAELFRIEDQQFAQYVHPDWTINNPEQDGKISRSSLRGKLWFYCVLVGFKETLDYLNKNDQLEIQGIVIINNIVRRTYDLTISSEKWDSISDALSGQLKMQHTFTYRIRFFTRLIDYDNIDVSIRDLNGNVLGKHSVQITP